MGRAPTGLGSARAGATSAWLNADQLLLRWMGSPPNPRREAPIELLAFGIKEARACVFAAGVLLAILVVPAGGTGGLPRYDLLLAIAVVLQLVLLWTGLETVDEAKAIAVFHVLGFALEAFKVSAQVGSWQYPEPAFSKVVGVPLFAGFMYAAVGSYMIQAWRLLRLRVERHPPYWMTWSIAAALYLNFFTQHYWLDLRWVIAGVALGLYSRARVVFTPLHRERRMPLLLAFVLIGFFIWLAENFGTFFGVWQYPHQLGAWSAVHLNKWSAWAMLSMMTFAVVTNLKHIKATIEIDR